MAVKNRTEAIYAVDTKIVSSPKVTNGTHRDLLNNDILNSVIFRKDVIGSQTPVGGVLVVDFETNDLVTISTSADISISFTNIENGDIKYIELWKFPANTVTFTGATDISFKKDYINTTATHVVYKVANKNGFIYVESVNIDNYIDIPTYTANLKRKVATFSGWNMTTTENFTITKASLGLTGKTIVSIEVTIIKDIGTKYPITMYTGGAWIEELTLITLARGGTSSIFNDVAFDNASGYIYIKYSD